MANTQPNLARSLASTRSRAQKFRAVTASLQAPVGGWNARDSIADMKPEDAVEMVNIFPSATDVAVRDGYAVWATGLGGTVESLMPYNGPTTSTLFAAVGSVFYDVTSPGAVGAFVQSGLTNARWQSANFATSGGNFMYCVNGADSARLYNGSTWNTITGVSVPAITGVTTSNLIHVTVFKRRLWFVEKNSLKLWYLPIDSIAGAAQMLDLRPYAGKGGYLMAAGVWTIDAGTGVDDLLVCATSEGQILVFRGIDPANDATWALAGTWDCGSPIGRRCMQKYAGDLIIQTYDGCFAMSSLLQSDRVDPHVALSDKIRTAMSNAVSSYAENFGWDITLFPRANMLIVNVPVNTNGAQEQYVMNTITKAWCRFTGWGASCWMLFNDEPYFGADGFVGRAWDDSQIDGDGAAITALCAQAYNYFGSHGQLKRFTMMRPIIRSNGVPAVLANVSVDYSPITPSASVSLSPGPVYPWDVGLWDVALWAGDVTYIQWQGITGMGYCASPVVYASVRGMSCQWLASDVVMEPGAVI